MFAIKLVSTTSGAHTTVNTKAKKQSAKKRRGLLAVFIVLIVVVIVVAGSLIWAGMTAKGLNGIYPNVTIAGQKVGGLSVSAAYQQLLAAGVGTIDSPILSVSLPMNIDFEIDTELACTCVSAEDIATTAYHYGRNGNFISNAFTYLRCLVFPKEVKFDSEIYIDEDYVRGIISEATKIVNADFLENSCVINEDSISIIKGSSGVLVTEDEIFEVVKKALINQDFSHIVFEPSANGDEEVDLQKIYDMIYIEVVDAKYDPEAYSITEDITGVSFDLGAAHRALDMAQYGESVVIPLIYTRPSITYEELSAIYFADVLAELTTNLTRVANRSNNVKLSVQAVNGTVLNPGDVFDYNALLGERTTARGYLEAAAYRGAEVVQEVGGGICQLSSMVYYCALYSNLEIVYRTNHRWMPSYIPPGMDATVSWGGPEFKFKNNTDYPIRIVATIDMDATYPENMTVQFFGTNTTGQYVKMDYYTTGVLPLSVIYKENAAIQPEETKVEREGWNGYIVETYRSVYAADGSLISRTFEAKSVYSPMDKLILVPPGSIDEDGNYNPVKPEPDPEPSPDPEPPETSTPGPENPEEVTPTGNPAEPTSSGTVH